MTLAYLPVVLLVSGVALTALGLVFAFAKGPATPPAFFVIMLVGLLDGAAGLLLAAATILRGATGPRAGDPGPSPVEAERERERMRALFLATGALSIVFLGLLAALAFQIPLIVQWLRGSRLF